jgi:hypothetical protein
MNPEKEKELARIKKDFLKIKKDHKLTKAEVDDFMSDATMLLGIFALRRKKEIKTFIEEMLSFGEKNNLAVSGLRLELKSILKRK